MKIKAVTNGNVIEADDGQAKKLIEAGIYVAYDEKKEKRGPASPLTARDIPRQPKRRKSG